MTNPLVTLESRPRYTVRMLQYFSTGLDINGVCRMVRDSLERGIIPGIEIEEENLSNDNTTPSTSTS